MCADHVAGEPHPDQQTDELLFTARLSHNGETATLWLGGEIDLAAGPAIVTTAAQAPACPLLVDMREVSFLDSCGIGVLLRLRRDREAHGHSTHIVWPSVPARATLSLTGLLDHLVLDLPSGARAAHLC